MLVRHSGKSKKAVILVPARVLINIDIAQANNDVTPKCTSRLGGAPGSRGGLVVRATTWCCSSETTSPVSYP